MYPADFPDAIENASESAAGPTTVRQLLPATALLGAVFFFVLMVLVDGASRITALSPVTVVIASLAVLASSAASCRTSGQLRGVWMLISAGCVAWGTGLVHSTDGPMSIQLVESAAYCLAVFCFAIGALSLSHLEFRATHPGQKALDLVPPIVALAIFNWTAVVGPRFHESGMWSIGVFTGLLHGIGSSVLLAIGITGVLGSRWAREILPRMFVFGAIGLLAIADVMGQERVISSTGISDSSHIVASLVGLSLLTIAAVTSILRRQDFLDATLPADRAEVPAGVVYYLQFGSLGLLLLLSIFLRTLEKTAPSSELIADVGAFAVLVFIVARHSFLIRAERVLQAQIGELSEQLDSLVSQVGRDPLTGLFNHRAVHERLDLELMGGKASGGTVAIVLIDVDNFKTINDTLGHQAGDRVLRAVSTILVSACRASDVAARYAGDEFMLILPGLDERHAGSVCERIASEVRRLNSDLHLGGGIQVTLSIGVAVTHNCDRNVVQNVAIADAAMYDAKESGKNRVVVVNADTLQISPPLAAPTVDQLMAESRVLFDWDSERATAS